MGNHIKTLKQTYRRLEIRAVQRTDYNKGLLGTSESAVSWNTIGAHYLPFRCPGQDGLAIFPIENKSKNIVLSIQ